jgi:hypothetical protein
VIVCEQPHQDLITRCPVAAVIRARFYLTIYIWWTWFRRVTLNGFGWCFVWDRHDLDPSRWWLHDDFRLKFRFRFEVVVVTVQQFGATPIIWIFIASMATILYRRGRGGLALSNLFEQLFNCGGPPFYWSGRGTSVGSYRLRCPISLELVNLFEYHC